MMTEPPEWLLWAKHFKDSHAEMTKRIETLEREYERYRQEKEILQTETHSTIPSSKMLGVENRQHEPSQTDLANPNAILPTQPEIPPKPDEQQASKIHQGPHSLTDYLKVGQSIYTDLETHLVDTFLAGMASRHQRAALESALAKTSRSWQSLEKAIEKMVADAERRRKNRRNLAT